MNRRIQERFLQFLVSPIVKRRSRSRTLANPFFAWGSLALQTAEMMAASAQVIHHRTSRNNNAAQLFEMGNEKVQAAIEASHAMTRHWLTMQGRPGPALFTQWAGLFASGLTPFHARAVKNARRATRR
jgi:hypothetical protein